MGKVLILQYCGWLLLVVLFMLWRKKRPLKMSGITLNGQSWKYLVLLGVGAWAFGDFLNKVLWILECILISSVGFYPKNMFLNVRDDLASSHVLEHA